MNGWVEGSNCFHILSSGVLFTFAIVIPLQRPENTFPYGSMWTPLAERKDWVQFLADNCWWDLSAKRSASSPAARPVNLNGY